MLHRLHRISAVLFDFDGTLTKPGALNFSQFKKSIGCPVDRPILEFIESRLPDPINPMGLIPSRLEIFMV